MKLTLTFFWRWALFALCALSLMACSAMTRFEDTTTGVGLTGIDHLEDHLSVQDFSVNGYGGFNAGKGGSLVCCVVVPNKWRPGLKAHVVWSVTNWRDKTWQNHQADVLLDRYEEVGRMYVHFLKDGSVRITLSNYAPTSPVYEGPRDPIPRKWPWVVYPPPKGPRTPFDPPDDKSN